MISLSQAAVWLEDYFLLLNSTLHAHLAWDTDKGLEETIVIVKRIFKKKEKLKVEEETHTPGIILEPHT